ncbi:MAG: ABC transporter substrate-binding protein, partial [Gemmatimonadota bacterium]|nr:ABC transporter substrate-binding protein [Gemmatimonadota bacterium]
MSPTSGARGLSALGDFVFRIPLTTAVVIPRGIKATQAILGYQRVVTIYDQTDLFSTDRDETLRETFVANGIEVLTTEPFDSGDTDFSAQLTRIKELNPEAIFVSALPPEKPGILIQGHDLGLSVPFVVSSLTDREVQAAGVAAEGAITFT